MMRWMSSKLAMGAPAIDTILSSAWMPARAAALPGNTSPATGRISGRPAVANSRANSTMASRKFAIGPGGDDERARRDRLFVEHATGDPAAGIRDRLRAWPAGMRQPAGCVRASA